METEVTTDTVLGGAILGGAIVDLILIIVGCILHNMSRRPSRQREPRNEPLVNKRREDEATALQERLQWDRDAQQELLDFDARLNAETTYPFPSLLAQQEYDRILANRQYAQEQLDARQAAVRDAPPEEMLYRLCLILDLKLDYEQWHTIHPSILAKLNREFSVLAAEALENAKKLSLKRQAVLRASRSQALPKMSHNRIVDRTLLGQ